MLNLATIQPGKELAKNRPAEAKASVEALTGLLDLRAPRRGSGSLVHRDRCGRRHASAALFFLSGSADLRALCGEEWPESIRKKAARAAMVSSDSRFAHELECILQRLNSSTDYSASAGVISQPESSGGAENDWYDDGWASDGEDLLSGSSSSGSRNHGNSGRAGFGGNPISSAYARSEILLRADTYT